jgi:hypothetical protein
VSSVFEISGTFINSAENFLFIDFRYQKVIISV